jgi:hypothetical protein
MKLAGGCHCGAVRYEIDGEPLAHALCHCSDCRRHAGAPVVSWMMCPESVVTITNGSLRTYHSSQHGRRQFCADCGTGLFYLNAEMMPGLIDVQSATCDTPEAVPAQAHIQVAERIAWMRHAHELPEFERFPPQD